MAAPAPIDPGQGTSLTDLLNIFSRLGPMFLGSGKTTETTSQGGPTTTTPNLNPDVMAQVQQLMQILGPQAAGTDNNSIVQNILDQSAKAFAPTMGLERTAGLYNSTDLALLSQASRGEAGRNALSALTAHQSAAANTMAGVLSNLTNASTGKSVVAPQQTTTRTTAPAVSPTTSSSALGGLGLLMSAPKAYTTLKGLISGDPKNLNPSTARAADYQDLNAQSPEYTQTAYNPVDAGNYGAGVNDFAGNFAGDQGGFTGFSGGVGSGNLAEANPVSNFFDASAFTGQDLGSTSVFNPASVISDTSSVVAPDIGNFSPDTSATSGVTNPLDFSQYETGQHLSLNWTDGAVDSDSGAITRVPNFTDQTGASVNPTTDLGWSQAQYETALKSLPDGGTLGDSGVLTYGFENNDLGALFEGGLDPAAVGTDYSQLGFSPGDFSDYSDYLSNFDFSDVASGAAEGVDAAAMASSELAAEAAGQVVAEMIPGLNIAYGFATTLSKASIICTQMNMEYEEDLPGNVYMPKKYWAVSTRQFLNYPAWIRRPYYVLARRITSYLRQAPNSLMSKMLRSAFQKRSEHIAAKHGVPGAKRNFLGASFNSFCWTIGIILSPFCLWLPDTVTLDEVK